MEQKERRFAPVYVIAAGICWGVIGLFSRRLAAGGFAPVQITALRCGVAACGLVAVILIQGADGLRIRVRDIRYFIGTGILSIVFFNICYFITTELTTLSVASVLLYTAPSFVVLLSAAVFGERMTPKKTVSLFLSFGGCILITGVWREGGGKLPLYGILTGLGSGLGYALYSIFGGLALKKYDTRTVTVYTFLVASVSLLPFCRPLEMISFIRADKSLLLYGLLLGVVSTMLPFLLYTKGLSGMEAGKAAVMAFVEPMVSTLVGIFLFGEKLTPANGCGIGLIFLSVALLNLNKTAGKRTRRMNADNT